MAKLVDALDLGSSEHPSWEFESLRPQDNSFKYVNLKLSSKFGFLFNLNKITIISADNMTKNYNISYNLIEECNSK